MEPHMHLHSDLTQRVVLNTLALDWTNSPEAGVTRRMMERDGGEVARATSIVRYAPGSRFAVHEHGGGEELLVLEGTFADEHGVYPAGTYLRNPPGSTHAPYSEEGCLLLVKLRQFGIGEEPRLVVDTANGTWVPGAPDTPARQAIYQSADGQVTVGMARFAPGAHVEPHAHEGGEELFIMEGALEDEWGKYPAGTWLRQPDGSRHHPVSPGGCTLWIKRGHLPRV